MNTAQQQDPPAVRDVHAAAIANPVSAARSTGEPSVPLCAASPAASAAAPVFIGFPPPQLGPQPVRLAAPAHAAGILALEKPAGIAWETAAADTPAVLPALRAQLAAGKSELAPFALDRPASVWNLETEIHGVGLLVSRGTALERWRNALGSCHLVFTYELLVPADPARPARLECTLPVALHRDGARALISHETGRKSRTIFQRQTTVGKWEWWTATTDYPRFHQVRIHAAESALPVAGEELYFASAAPATPAVLRSASAANVRPRLASAASARPRSAFVPPPRPHLATSVSARPPVPFPRVEDFLRRGRLNKGEAAPLLDAPALRLASVALPAALRPSGFPAVLCAPVPHKWLALRKRLNARSEP